MSEPVTFTVEKRANGAWAVKPSDEDQPYGNYDTQALAEASAEGATWRELRRAAGPAEVAR